jgi:hypothetical protein
VDQEALVEQELLEHLARLIKLVFGGHGTGRRKQQLQGREPLLSIDDGSRIDHLGRDERLLQHDRTEEMGYRVVRRHVVKLALSDGADVLPEGLPKSRTPTNDPPP